MTTAIENGMPAVKLVRSLHGRRYAVVQIGGDDRYTTGDLERGDAKKIVRAVNSHEQLLKACRQAAMSHHHPACECKGEYSGRPDMYCTCHVQKARAAIAAATR
jgi:hypothetical protein